MSVTNFVTSEWIIISTIDQSSQCLTKTVHTKLSLVMGAAGGKKTHTKKHVT